MSSNKRHSCDSSNVLASKKAKLDDNNIKGSKYIIKAGNLDDLKLTDFNINKNTLDENEILIEVKYCGINMADMFACQGLYSATPEGMFTPGLEFSGKIIAIGSTSEHKYDIGDNVIGCCRFGGYSSHIITNHQYIRKLPDNWSLAEGCAFIAQALTAYYGLFELGNIGNVKNDNKVVLVHSAAGGVGLFTLKLLLYTKSIPIATVGNEKKKKYLLKIFPKSFIKAEQIIVRNNVIEFGKQLDDALISINRKGIDISMDSLLGSFFQPTWDRLNYMSRVIVFGAGSMTTIGSKPNYFKLAYRYLFERPKLDLLEMISQNRSVMAFNLIWLWDSVEKLSYLLDNLMDIFVNETDTVGRPIVGHILPFSDAIDALKLIQSGKSVGKIVLEI